MSWRPSDAFDATQSVFWPRIGIGMQVRKITDKSDRHRIPRGATGTVEAPWGNDTHNPDRPLVRWHHGDFCFVPASEVEVIE